VARATAKWRLMTRLLGLPLEIVTEKRAGLRKPRGSALASAEVGLAQFEYASYRSEGMVLNVSRFVCLRWSTQHSAMNAASTSCSPPTCPNLRPDFRDSASGTGFDSAGEIPSPVWGRARIGVEALEAGAISCSSASSTISISSHASASAAARSVLPTLVFGVLRRLGFDRDTLSLYQKP